MSFKIKLLHPDAKVPTRGSPQSAGYDLYASESMVVPARGRALVKTGVAVAAEPCPLALHPPTELQRQLTPMSVDSVALGLPGYAVTMYFRVAPRSGLAVKSGLDVGAGVVDADYRGEVGVVLFNHSDVDHVVMVGDRVAQLIPTLTMHPAADSPFEVVDSLDETVRGAGGFGSTGTS